MPELNPYQRRIEEIVGRGNPLTQAALVQALTEFFGPIDESVLPPGATIISRSPDGLNIRYRDREGYEHNLTRNTDARNAGTFGDINDQSSRPPVLPATAEPGVGALFDRVVSDLTNRGGFAELPDDVRAELEAIQAASDAQLQQMFTQGQGQLVANLFGQGTNRSTLAGDAASRLLQGQGLVQQQSNADAAGRRLALQEFLSGQNANLFSNITGQNTQREIAGANVALGRDQLAQQQDQFMETLRFQREQADAQRGSFLRSLLSGAASAGLSFFGGGIPTAVGGILDAATSGRGR